MSEPMELDVTTTLSFPAHPDDDLLFMNPDIISDIQAGYRVWVVYLTAGDVPYRDGVPWGGMEYANMRIEGVRAAYARAARTPNEWTFERMYFADHELATNRLDGTEVRLIFTFIHAAGPGDPCGDLYRMLHDEQFVAQPIDGRAPYQRASFVSMLSSIIDTVQPDYIRTQNSLGHRDPDPDHIDHVAGAILAANASVEPDGSTKVYRYEYLGYVIRSSRYPDNVDGYWRAEKTDVWNEYWRHDPEVAPHSWNNVMGKQYAPTGRVFLPGTQWIPPDDFKGC